MVTVCCIARTYVIKLLIQFWLKMLLKNHPCFINYLMASLLFRSSGTGSKFCASGPVEASCASPSSNEVINAALSSALFARLGHQ